MVRTAILALIAALPIVVVADARDEIRRKAQCLQVPGDVEGGAAEHGVAVGARTALGIQRCADEHVGERFNPNRVGMHHLCFRARSREDVEAIAKKLREMDAFIDRGPIEGDWAPGYYYVVFEDPDGIRLEVNYLPGKGLLAGEQSISPSDDPNWDQNP